jgi:hypothetical protein
MIAARQAMMNMTTGWDEIVSAILGQKLGSREQPAALSGEKYE